MENVTDAYNLQETIEVLVKEVQQIGSEVTQVKNDEEAINSKLEGLVDKVGLDIKTFRNKLSKIQ